MAKDFNQAIIMGNLTRDPELRSTPSGQSVASFAVATNRSWQDPQSGDKKDAVEFHDVVAWGKLGELCANYLTKGRKVLVVGRLQTRSWDGNDGVKRQKTEIVATDINFLSAGPGDGGHGEASAPAAAKAAKSDDAPPPDDMGGDEINLDDIPF
ncbi:single-stranded DNA-binding protein [Candidatus Saccharibacteria bacterium]|nr:single-stranded DNA-binding protein [Candidatus Saccharibacteria bacterium]